MRCHELDVALSDDTAVLRRGGEGEDTTVVDTNMSHNGMHANTLHALSNIAID